MLQGTRQAAREADAVAFAIASSGLLGYALAMAGEARCTGLDGAAQAERYHAEALALAGALGMRPLVARCHLGLGGLYRRLGSPTLARDHLATAVAMLSEMQMRYWLKDAEAEMAIVEQGGP